MGKAISKDTVGNSKFSPLDFLYRKLGIEDSIGLQDGGSGKLPNISAGFKQYTHCRRDVGLFSVGICMYVSNCSLQINTFELFTVFERAIITELDLEKYINIFKTFVLKTLKFQDKNEV